MLRRSVSRAFATGEGETAREPAPALPVPPREAAVDRLFEELFEGFRSRAASMDLDLDEGWPEGAPMPADGVGLEGERPPDGGVAPPGARLRVSAPRAQASGYEFVVDGRSGRLRCINTLLGFLLLKLEAGRAVVREELVSVHGRGGALRPIRKRLQGPGAEPARREGFRFTCVDDLVRDSLRRLGEEG